MFTRWFFSIFKAKTRCLPGFDPFPCLIHMFSLRERLLGVTVKVLEDECCSLSRSSPRTGFCLRFFFPYQRISWGRCSLTFPGFWKAQLRLLQLPFLKMAGTVSRGPQDLKMNITVSCFFSILALGFFKLWPKSSQNPRTFDFCFF